VHCVALKRIGDLELLERILAAAGNPRVREHARTQLFGLMAGTLPGVDAGERTRRLQGAGDVAVIEHVARHGNSVELRTLAIQKVVRQPLLVELVYGDAAIAVRLVALERIESSEHLTAICKQARGRDKRIYRAAKQRLEQQQLLSQRPAEMQRQYADLCVRVEALLKCNTPESANAALSQLQQQWLALMQEAEPEAQYIDRYAEAVAAIGEMENAWKQQQLEREQGALAQLERLQALVEQSEHGELDQARVDLLARQLAACEQGWRALPQRPDEDELARYRELAGALRQRLRDAGGELSTQSQAQAACDRALQLLAAKQPVAAAALRAIQRSWPGQVADSGLQGQFDQATKALQQRIDEQTRKAGRMLSEATELTVSLEQALEAGESRSAVSLQQKIRQSEKRLKALGLELPEAVRQRLQRLAGRLRELHDWQRFSNTTEREQLCEQVESLIGADLPVRDLARQIKTARASWRKPRKVQK